MKNVAPASSAGDEADEGDVVEAAPATHSRPSKRLGLVPVRGDFPTEEVFHRAWRRFEFFVKRESPTSPWEWVITEGRDPIEFGDGYLSFDEAERVLASLVEELAPDLLVETHVDAQASRRESPSAELLMRALFLVAEVGELVWREGRAFRRRALVALRHLRDDLTLPR